MWRTQITGKRTVLKSTASEFFLEFGFSLGSVYVKSPIPKSNLHGISFKAGNLLDTEATATYILWVDRRTEAYPYEWGCVSPGGSAAQTSCHTWYKQKVSHLNAEHWGIMFKLHGFCVHNPSIGIKLKTAIEDWWVVNHHYDWSDIILTKKN